MTVFWVERSKKLVSEFRSMPGTDRFGFGHSSRKSQEKELWGSR